MDEKHSDQNLVNWLTLVRAPAITPAKLTKLLDYFKEPENLIGAKSKDLLTLGVKRSTVDFLKHPDLKSIEDDLKWLESGNNHFISIQDENYPALLRELPVAPIALFIIGDLKILNSIQICIVGSRNPTPDGKRTAREFARELAGAGLVITSGLAIGIDSAAHTGALDNGSVTLAVLGNGLDTIYPTTNKVLAGKILEAGGALVSEFPIRVKPVPLNFPRRNRIISGLSVGTVVVEAAIRSGSLITAHCAVEQGREVFAIPGSIHNPMSRGCHALIREGAKLTEKIKDILEEVGQLESIVRISESVCRSKHNPDQTLDEPSKVLLDNIGYRLVTIDLLFEETGIPVKQLHSMLLSLELNKLIESVPGGEYIRRNLG